MKKVCYVCDICKYEMGEDQINGIDLKGGEIFVVKASDAEVHICLTCMQSLRSLFLGVVKK